MGLLVQELQEADRKFQKVKGNYGKLFNTEGSGKRINDLDGIIFSNKSAVVICGISGVGKTTFVNEFVKKHPDFKVCSMDEASYRVAIRNKGRTTLNGGKDILDEFEKDFRNTTRHGGKVIIDGSFANVVNRAAVLNALHILGYTTYVFFYSEKTTEKMIKKCSLSRAVGVALAMDYLLSREPSEKGITFEDNLNVTKNIYEILEKKTGNSREYYTSSMSGDLRVIEQRAYLMTLAEREKERTRFIKQLHDRDFTLGTDYYHVF